MGEDSSAIPLDRIAECVDHFGVVIYTIPLSIPQLSGLNLSPSKLIIEANYKDPCLSGENYISGLEWLKYQAIISFNLMTCLSSDEESVNNFIASL